MAKKIKRMAVTIQRDADEYDFKSQTEATRKPASARKSLVNSYNCVEGPSKLMVPCLV
jgi:hypothetical protein